PQMKRVCQKLSAYSPSVKKQTINFLKRLIVLGHLLAAFTPNKISFAVSLSSQSLTSMERTLAERKSTFCLGQKDFFSY
ncbi:hypothetical protein, partial [Lysinibacillus fusiformis]|uniref:hypothetical protein n=1 Tax=Lysinibacillus fusiformis TaxID=28031 RepID=UPI0020BD91D3